MTDATSETTLATLEKLRAERDEARKERDILKGSWDGLNRPAKEIAMVLRSASDVEQMLKDFFEAISRGERLRDITEDIVDMGIGFVRTFEEAGFSGNDPDFQYDRGIVLRMRDDSEFQLIIVQSDRASRATR